MNKLIRILFRKLNNIVLVVGIVIVGGLIVGTYVFASNIATQEASTSAASTISVVGKSADDAITTITFPQSSPGSTVSNPYNNVDTVSDAQVLSETVSEPVVRLKNTSGGVLNVTLEITTWTEGVAVAEDYELVDIANTSISTVTSVLSADGNANSVDTGIGMNAAAYKALYLELVLSGVAGKTGNSTLTVLGETP